MGLNIKLCGYGVNYIESWTQKTDLKQMGEDRIDADYIYNQCQKPNGSVCDISGLILDDGVIIQVIDEVSGKTTEFSLDDIEMEEDDFTVAPETSYDDFDKKDDVLIRFVRIEKGPYFEFDLDKTFNISDLILIQYNLEPFNDCTLIIGAKYKGSSVKLDYGNTTGQHDEVRFIHDIDQYCNRDKSDSWVY